MLTSNPYDTAQGERRGGTVGFPLPGVQLRIVGTDGKGLPAGTVGAIEVRGPNVFSGYWRMPEKTREEFSADGWFRTGDVARIDADGFVWIEGRVSDMINRGGHKVHPGEVEEVLRLAPAVADAAVVGVADDRLGEVPVAYIIEAAPVTDEALEALGREHLAPYKVPVRYLRVAELPRNENGKVLKRDLAAQAAAGGAS
jgi:malonyl-CoA/methylmalonyl-CoA synthetase